MSASSPSAKMSASVSFIAFNCPWLIFFWCPATRAPVVAMFWRSFWSLSFSALRSIGGFFLRRLSDGAVARFDKDVATDLHLGGSTVEIAQVRRKGWPTWGLGAQVGGRQPEPGEHCDNRSHPAQQPTPRYIGLYSVHRGLGFGGAAQTRVYWFDPGLDAFAACQAHLGDPSA